jgi:hypothetical protein
MAVGLDNERWSLNIQRTASHICGFVRSYAVRILREVRAQKLTKIWHKRALPGDTKDSPGWSNEFPYDRPAVLLDLVDGVAVALSHLKLAFDATSVVLN